MVHYVLNILLLFVFTTTTLPQNERPPAPEQLSPKDGEVLDNGCTGKRNGILWGFEWSEVPLAQRYHLYVMGKYARIPVIDKSDIDTTAYSRWSPSSYVAEHNLEGWRWKVRAMVDGVWGAWSSESTFDVEPLNTDCKPPMPVHPTIIRR